MHPGRAPRGTRGTLRPASAHGPTDPPGVREGVVGGAARADGDERRTVRGETGDAVEERGLAGSRQGHRLREGGEPPGRHRRAFPGGRAGRLSPHPRRHDQDTACGCGAGSATCLIGASRRGADAIGPQIESRCSGLIARLRVARQLPCSVRIALEAELTRVTATARLLLCTRSSRRPQRPCDRPQHHNQAGVGQAQPAGGNGPAVSHNASAGDEWGTAIEGHPRRFAPRSRAFRRDDPHGEVPRASRKSPACRATES